MHKALAGKILLVVSIILVLLLGRIFGSRYYTSWNDESVFIEIAESYVSSGVLGAPSFEGNGLKMSEKMYFMPPVYPLSLSVWFSLFKPSLLSARFFSNILGCVALLFFYLLAFKLNSNHALAGMCTLLLASDIQFFATINWARPEILTIAISFAAFYAYFIYLKSDGDSIRNLFIAWLLVNLGMMVHPIAGSIGFFTILFHLVIVRHRVQIQPKVIFYLFLITLVFVSSWAIYLLEDMQSFRYQFIDFQLHRKAEHVDGLKGLALSFYYTFFNKGLSSLKPLALLRVFVLFGLIIYAFREKKNKNAALLVLIALVISNAVVEFGKELAYLNLYIPFFYLGVFFLLGSFEDRLLRVPLKFIGQYNIQIKFISWSLLICLFFNSGRHIFSTVKEIRYSERASSYDPSTLASRIDQLVPPQKTLGMSCFPDCYDILFHSGRYSKIHKLSWHRLNHEELVANVLRNDYLAITESFFNPSFINALNDFKNQGIREYDIIAEENYQLIDQIVLPGGAITKIWKKRS